MTDDAGLPAEAYAAALAGLPGMGPRGLAAVLRCWSPEDAWNRAETGRLQVPEAERRLMAGDETLAAVWRRQAATVDVGAGWATLLAAGVETAVLGHDGYPPALAADHEPPAVVFSRGDRACLEGPSVAIVGTRNCTRYGREVAFELARDLAANGVRVVSGLALGIDGAAHAGALEGNGSGQGPPVAVVGSGLDVVYPRRHARLWSDVAAAGVVLSEAPLGAAPEAWRFPVRNRIIAALADIVVVVESPHTGGSRHTVDAALARDRPVMAVPGPVRSPTSDLPNALLADGCHPVRDALDVLVALDLGGSSTAAARTRPQPDARPPPDPSAAAVLEAIGWQPAAFEQVVVASERTPAEVGVALARLERDGWVTGSGGWWERVGVAGTTV